MRPIFALLVAVVILGGAQFFLSASRPAPAVELDRAPAVAEGKFTMDVLLTFDAIPDPFTEEQKAAALTVLFAGRRIYGEDQPLPVGSVVQIDDVAGIKVGTNEFFVSAFPADSDPDRVHAVRVRVLRDGWPIATNWLASEPGKPVDGPILVIVPETRRVAHEEH